LRSGYAPALMTAAMTGLDAYRLEGWLSANVPGAQAPFAYERISGGRSNLTYAVRDGAGRRFILRRPPQGATLGSAHDMGREHRILAALAGTDVPSPVPLAQCSDPEVTGAEFYVMDFVDGVVLRDEADAERAFPAEADRRAVAESLVDALVAIHAVDPGTVGLGELGRREGYVERQLRRWARQWEASKTRELPAMETTQRRLAERIPAQGDARLVHGDFRLDNAIVAPTGAIAAVVDWELCTLGDPLADVGLLMVYWAEEGDGASPLGRPATLAPGFPRRTELAERYAAGSGRDIGDLDFFVALGYWKLAAILEGVHARASAGAYGDAGSEFHGFGPVVEQLAGRALELADGLR
jgi:aminoglycoside phosphotransferase (APT) family kinase protein